MATHTGDWNLRPDYLAACDWTPRPDGRTTYVVPHKARAGDPTDVTSFHPGQWNWSINNMPDIIYQLEKDVSWDRFRLSEKPAQKVDPITHQPMFERWPKTLPARPLLDYAILPDQIGTEEEPWYIESIRRYDPRITYEDIMMRMMNVGSRAACSESEFRNRYLNNPASRNFRPKFSIISWHGHQTAARARILANLDAVQLAANTTRGTTPGLVDPNQPYGRRIELPPTAANEGSRPGRRRNADNFPSRTSGTMASGAPSTVRSLTTATSRSGVSMMSAGQGGSREQPASETAEQDDFGLPEHQFPRGNPAFSYQSIEQNEDDEEEQGIDDSSFSPNFAAGEPRRRTKRRKSTEVDDEADQESNEFSSRGPNKHRRLHEVDDFRLVLPRMTETPTTRLGGSLPGYNSKGSSFLGPHPVEMGAPQYSAPRPSPRRTRRHRAQQTQQHLHRRGLAVDHDDHDDHYFEQPLQQDMDALRPYDARPTWETLRDDFREHPRRAGVYEHPGFAFNTGAPQLPPSPFQPSFTPGPYPTSHFARVPNEHFRSSLSHPGKPPASDSNSSLEFLNDPDVQALDQLLQPASHNNFNSDESGFNLDNDETFEMFLQRMRVPETLPPAPGIPIGAVSFTTDNALASNVVGSTKKRRRDEDEEINSDETEGENTLQLTKKPRVESDLASRVFESTANPGDDEMNTPSTQHPNRLMEEPSLVEGFFAAPALERQRDVHLEGPTGHSIANYAHPPDLVVIEPEITITEAQRADILAFEAEAGLEYLEEAGLNMAPGEEWFSGST